MLRNRTSSKPILDVGFQAAAPDLDQLPVSRLIRINGVQSLNIGHRRFVTSKDVNVPLLDGDRSGQVPVTIELRLLSPAIVLDRVHFASLGGVVEPGPNRVNEGVAHGSQTVPLSGVDHVRQLDEGPIPELVSVVARLGSVLGTTCDEYPAVVSLDRAESDRNIEVDVEDFSLLSFVVDVVEGHNLLVELEEVNLVRSCRF